MLNEDEYYYGKQVEYYDKIKQDDTEETAPFIKKEQTEQTEQNVNKEETIMDIIYTEFLKIFWIM